MKNRISSLVFIILQRIRTKFYDALSTGHSKGRVTKIQPVLILGDGNIEFEKNVKLGYFPSPFFFNGYIHIEARGKISSIRFGEATHVNNNFVAIADHSSITIGKRCFIGTNVEIYDSDFHGIKISDRRTSSPDRARPVVIGDDVFIGSNVKIMKGVKIGVGSVVANGSIVVGEIPPGVIAGGNPARVLKAISTSA
ncbi:acyltransferase [Rhodoferax ferrireducens]|uniref:acyltransferase n=1 Tax=Rhodoferax ferrireducens TaxID=192843 RepID=UPI00298DCC99|nr:acyltransferase [Rhodoferax ferrireducens]WPC67661.1 acyltransferase [Rhodoferax ferrireducens]